MTLISEIVKIVLIVIIVLLGSAILRGLAKGIIKNEAAESYGRAFTIAVVWCVFYYFFTNPSWGVDVFILGNIPDAWNLWVRIAIYWVFFLILVGAIYRGSFGRTLLVAILFAIIVAFVVLAFEFILYDQICKGLPILCG